MGGGVNVWLRCLTLLTVVSLSACADLCGNDLVATTISPSSHRTAVVFERACGATTGHSTQLSVLSRSDALPNDPGNALVVDDRVRLDVRWVDDVTLEVRLPANAVTYKEQSRIGPVEVRYVR